MKTGLKNGRTNLRNIYLKNTYLKVTIKNSKG